MPASSNAHAQTQRIRTTCAYCGVGCGVLAEVNPLTREVGIQGDPDHPANFGRLCSKGSALGETLSLDERIAEPSINGQPCDWDTALATVAQQLSQTVAQHGPDSIMFYVSGQLLTEDYYVANKLIKGFIGSNNIDSNSRLCMSSAVAGYKRAFGSDTVPATYEDIEKSELFIICGSNMAWCHPVLFQRLKAAQEKDGKRVVVIDPRETDSCAIAQLHLPIKPGSDTVLFNGLLHYLAVNGHANSEYLKHCDGLEAALEAAASYNITAVAKQCDVAAEKITQFYQWFAETEKTVTFYSMGVNQSSSGTDKVNSIINCHAFTGRIGREGMGPFSITGQPNAMGGREVGALSNLLASHYDLAQSEHRQQVQSFWQAPQAISANPGVTAADAAQAILDGKIKAIWIMATNPVVSLTQANQFAQALEQCDLVIVSDCSAQSDTLRYAKIVLPAQGWSEKSGTVTNSERRISRQRRLLAPYAQAKPDWWILSRVAQKMGYTGFDYQSEYEVFKEHVALSAYHNNNQQPRSFNLSALSNLSANDYNELLPLQWPANKNSPNKPRFFAHGEAYTPNKKVQFIAIQPRPVQSQLSSQYPYALNTGRIRDQWHTMTRTALSPRLNQHLPEPFALIHPNDAAKHTINNGDLIQISSAHGQIVVQAKHSSGQRQGELFCPMHWNDHFSNNARVGQLIHRHLDPVSKQPEFKYTAVNIKPLPSAWFGLILLRQGLPDDTICQNKQLHYWVRNKNQQTQQYLLASAQPDYAANYAAELEHQLQQLCGASAEKIQMHDVGEQRWRLAFFANKQLQAVVFIEKTRELLPSTAWLNSCFQLNFSPSAQHADTANNTRKWLLAGQPAEGDFDVGRIVCSCFTVGEKTIRQAITKHNCQTPADIGRCLKAGTNCGSCIPELKQILADSHNSTPAP